MMNCRTRKNTDKQTNKKKKNNLRPIPAMMSAACLPKSPSWSMMLAKILIMMLMMMSAKIMSRMMMMMSTKIH